MATEGRQAQRGRQWVIVVGALLVAVGAVIIWLGLARDPTPYQRADGSFDWVAWGLPSWAPEPVVPDDNPMSFAKIDLGRHLFYDKRLSGNQTMSCGTCHEQALGFTDGKAGPVGITGERHPRTAMPLANVGYFPSLTWANPNLFALERQALLPIFGEHPVEMGMAGRETELVARLAADDEMRRRFKHAFPESGGAISLETITKAIATFERSLISLGSPYDRYRYGGEPDAISPAAKRGEQLFFSEKFECYHCHAAFLFSDNVRHKRLMFPEVGFHNNALYNTDGRGAYPPDNQGLFEFTGRPEDMGKFRTPSLRNIAKTAPYMHDGSLATLVDVLRHYAAGGRVIHEGEHRGEGRRSPLKDVFIVGFELEPDEQAAMIAFLDSLTDERFLNDPRHGDPSKTPR